MYNNHTKSTTSHSGLAGGILKLADQTGLIRVGRQLFSKSLTVINYHRIDNPHQPDFDSFKPNISASPPMFAEQMDYLKRWFNVVSVNDVVQWLHGKHDLPPYAALITFDDGYLDNYTQAYPILRKNNFPAVIFLTTGHIETDAPFYWDMAAYCFFHTSKDHVTFPDKSERSWNGSAQKESVSNAWIEALKLLPDSEKQNWAGQLSERLNVSIPANYFKNLMVNWEQVQEMNQNGIEFGGHTINHPILSRISPENARMEIEGSKLRIEQETGKEVLSFAYPNGMKNDLNPTLELLVAQAGYKAAFTLSNGPSSLREVKSNPFAIRRIFISHTHTMAHYAALTNPINRYRK
ncbi:MAG: polysaccharide deacetylase family protein [Chloroflexota bacterium]